MRLTAELNGVHATVNGLFSYPGILAPFGLTFLIDTGATCSCLLRDHVYYFGISYTNLPDAGGGTETAAGWINPKILGQADIYLPISDTEDELPTLRRIHFTDFQILPPPRRHSPEPRHRVVSLLGMGVLQNFTDWRWNWDSRKLVLDE